MFHDHYYLFNACPTAKTDSNLTKIPLLGNLGYIRESERSTTCAVSHLQTSNTLSLAYRTLICTCAAEFYFESRTRSRAFSSLSVSDSVPFPHPQLFILLLLLHPTPHGRPVCCSCFSDAPALLQNLKISHKL